jgi:hypothetical protein
MGSQTDYKTYHIGLFSRSGSQKRASLPAICRSE